MKNQTIICQNFKNSTIVFLLRTRKDQEIIDNVRRIWRALRRELGETEILINDFQTQGVQMFLNSGYSVAVDEDFILQNIILH